MTKKRQFDKGTVLILGLSGSRAYSTHNDDPELGKVSDIDFRGICFEELKDFFVNTNGVAFGEQESGFGTEVDTEFPELIENKDSKIYGLSKWLDMATKGSPNNMESLWLPKEHLIWVSAPGHELLAHRHLFMSKKMRGAYKGYAIAQINRLKRHRAWAMLGELKVPQISDYTDKLEPGSNLLTKSELGAFKSFLIMLVREAIESREISEEFRAYLRELPIISKVQQTDVPVNLFPSVQTLTNATDNFMSLLHATQRFKNAMTEYQDWLSWKQNRSEERAVLERKQGYDGKHAMHTLRLYWTGAEALRTGRLIVDLRDSPGLKTLLAIRQGEVPFEHMIALVDEAAQELDEAEVDSPLPAEPDFKQIASLKKWLYEKHFDLKL